MEINGKTDAKERTEELRLGKEGWGCGGMWVRAGRGRVKKR